MVLKYSFSEVKASAKSRDAWWTVFLVDPIALRIVWFVANFTRITPNEVSLLSLLVGLLSAAYFYQGNFLWGAILFELYFILDCVDGKLSRLKNKWSFTGAIIDHLGGLTVFLFCTLGIVFYYQTISLDFLFIIFIFLFMYGQVIAYFGDNLIFKSGGIKNNISITTSIISKNNKSIIKLFGIYRQALLKYRLFLIPGTIEAMHLVLFVFPLIWPSHLNIGLLIAIIMLIIDLLITSITLYFKLKFYKAT